MLTFPVKYLVRKPAVWTRKAKGRFYELLATYWQRAVALHVWAQRCGPADADHGLDGSGTGYHQHFSAGEGAAGIQHHRHRGRDHHPAGTVPDVFPQSGEAPGGEREVHGEGLVAHQPTYGREKAAADG